MANDHLKSIREMKAEYQGETYGGTIVDTDGGENPVMSPNEEVPNIIISNEKAGDWKEGEPVNGVKVTDVKDSYMFGEKIKSDKERKKENGENYQVVLKFIGNKMTSEVFTEEQDAIDLKDYLETKIDIGRVEVKRTR